ncbi:MAG: hypothetical protein R2844_14460 [Caldilineales bacterium]
MARRILSALTSVGVGAILVLLLAASIGSAAPETTEVSRVHDNSLLNSEANSVSARRAISVPFGIAITQELNSLGSQVVVTGHGNCWDATQMFDLHVRIAQSSTQAFAEGQTIDNCSSDEQQWDAYATVGSRERFEEGPASACAEATEWGVHGVVDEHAWCKDIELQKAGSPY